MLIDDFDEMVMSELTLMLGRMMYNWVGNSVVFLYELEPWLIQ